MTEPTTDRTSWWRRAWGRYRGWPWWAQLLVALLVVGVIAAPFSGGEEPDTTETASTNTTEDDTTTTEKRTTTTQATTSTTAKPTTTTLPPTVKYSGSGDAVQTIEKPEDGPIIAFVTVNGPQDNFTIYTLDDRGEQGDLIVNTIGNYQGTVAMDFEGEETKALEISGSAAWTIELKTLDYARSFDDKTTGTGDDVVLYTGDFGAATVTNDGPDDNFTIYYYTEDGTDLIVNEIGSYRGTVRMPAGPGFLEVVGAGKWSIDVN